MAFELPKLDYAYDALEPHIDAQTMEIHHTKHHQAYVNNVNKALEGSEFADLDVNELMKKLNEIPENIRTAVRNNGGGHANHSFFWKIMSPDGGGNPAGDVQKVMHEKWGSFDKFKEEFAQAAMTRFGSGWAWLVLDNGGLKVVSTANQDNPLTDGQTPLLGLDVWEHAYYLKYQNKRADYVNAFFNVVDWKKVDEHFKNAVK